MKQFMDSMEKQLKEPGIRDKLSNEQSPIETNNQANNNQNVNIANMQAMNEEFAVLKNILASYSEEQAHGLSNGPASTLLKSLGISLPANDDLYKLKKKR
jgi:hypothetical protein